MELSKIDKSWTLFLDRDGVINHEKKQDYIYNYLEFKFYDGALEAIRKFNGVFGKILIATNQKGVEKKLMTEHDLISLHKEMMRDIEDSGGRIDAIFYCTSLENDHPNRKPNPGMAFIARERFPEIDFSKSIMVGNNLSDMYFGRNAGMHTVFVRTTNPELPLPDPAIDLACDDLVGFANLLEGMSDSGSNDLGSNDSSKGGI
jgi:histidinol-phosphate phosphatase family protein